MTSSQLDSKKRVKSKKKSNTFLKTNKSFVYDLVFEQHFIDHKMYLHKYNYNNDNDFVYLDN